MNSRSEEYLNVVSAATFLESSERKLGQDVNDDRDISPNYITANLGGGDTANVLDLQNEFSNQFGDTDNSRVVEGAISSSECSNVSTPASFPLSVNSDQTVNSNRLGKQNISRAKSQISHTHSPITPSLDISEIPFPPPIKPKLVQSKTSRKPFKPVLPQGNKYLQAEKVNLLNRCFNAKLQKIDQSATAALKHPLVTRQKINMKIHSDDILNLQPRTRHNFSVPTQLKSEALWHENVLHVVVRGPPSRLPLIDLASSQTNGTYEMPIDIDLTFIPTNTREFLSQQKKPLLMTRKNVSSLKPKKKTVTDLLDRNIIENRAIGTPFKINFYPENYKKCCLPKVKQDQPNITGFRHCAEGNNLSYKRQNYHNLRNN